jgi:GNAT superfamily N-acetyltransferase
VRKLYLGWYIISFTLITGEPDDVCYLQDLFTLKKQRRKGIAKALIQAVYEAADANKTSSVYWMTQDFNLGARKLYDQVASLTPFIKYQR